MNNSWVKDIQICGLRLNTTILKTYDDRKLQNIDTNHGNKLEAHHHFGNHTFKVTLSKVI